MMENCVEFPISREVPGIVTIESVIVTLMKDNNLVGPLSPEEINVDIKINGGLTHASCTEISEAVTHLIAQGKLRVIFAAKVGEELRAYFGLTYPDTYGGFVDPSEPT